MDLFKLKYSVTTFYVVTNHTNFIIYWTLQVLKINDDEVDGTAVMKEDWAPDLMGTHRPKHWGVSGFITFSS